MRYWVKTYRDTVCVLLSDSLSFSLALLEGMLVLELGTHIDDVLWVGWMWVVVFVCYLVVVESCVGDEIVGRKREV